MFKNENLSLYGYALLLTGVILASSLYMEPARVEVARLTHGGDDAWERDLQSGQIATAAIPERAAPTIGETWNSEALSWRTYGDGLAEMQRTGKLGVLVIQGADCVLCSSYQRQFYAPEVAQYSDDYVFILADAEREPAVQQLYNLDGDYLPRTFILSPNGGLRRSATSTHSTQKFLVDPYGPDVLANLLESSR